MTRHVALYIKDILQNMRDAEQFIEGMTYEQFVDDKKTFNAVVRAIERWSERPPRTSRPQFGLDIQPFPGRKWPACGTKSRTSISESTGKRFGSP